MHTSHTRGRLAAANWQYQEESIQQLHHPFASPQPFEYVDNFSRGYNTGRNDGTLAGLVIGTIAGIVAAAMLGGII